MNQPPARVPPGSTIWLRGGTYRGRFESRLAGTAASAIVVRPFTGEWARIDGNYEVTLSRPLETASPRSQSVLTVADSRCLRAESMVLIDHELMQVRSVRDNSVTVVRGWDGTCPPAGCPAHAAGSAIRLTDSILQASGAHTWFWGFEITNSSPVRTTIDGERGSGINARGQGHNVINMIIHDVGHPGVGFWEQVGDGGEIYGSLLWGNGIYDRDGAWTRGSGVYAQNRTGTRYITNNIWFRNFTTGINLYTQAGYTDGFAVTENIAFENNGDDIWGTGGDHPMQRLTVAGNYTYRKPSNGFAAARFGYTEEQGDAVIEDNYFGAGRGSVLGLNQFAAATVRRNTFILNPVPSAGNEPKFANVRLGASAARDAYVWDGNTYYDALGSSEKKTYFFTYDDRMTTVSNALGGGQLSFDEPGTRLGKGWRQWTGWDGGSAYVFGRPPNAVFVRPNKYESGRAHIAVFNWSHADAVSVDVSSVGLETGDMFEVRDAQNYFAPPVVAGRYSGKPIAIPMTGLTTAPLAGSVPHVDQTHTAPEFGAFVLMRTGS